MNIIRPLCFLFLLLVCSHNYAQDLSSGQIKQKMTTVSQQKKADLYLDLGVQLYYESGNPDSLIKYCLKSLALAEKLNEKNIQVNAYKFSANGYSLKRDFVNSNKQLNKGLALAKKINHQMSIADIYNKFGYNYQMVNQPEKAIESYLHAAESFEKINEWGELIIVYQNVSSIFSELEHTEETAFYTRKMIETLPRVTSKFHKASTYSAVTDRFYRLSKSNPKYLDSVYKYTQIGIPFALKNNFNDEAAGLYNSLANYNYAKQNIALSLTNYKKALSFKGAINEGVKADAYFGLYNCYSHEKNWKLAGQCLDSIATFPLIQSYLSLKVQYYQSRYAYSKQTNNNTQALIALEVVKGLEDSLLNAKKTKIISELEQKYNRTKNESTIKGLNQQQKILVQKDEIQQLQITQLIFGVLLLFIIIALIAYFYWNSNQNKKRKIIEIEQRLNRARMDPHFTFNVLAALQSLQLNPDRKEEVGEYIGRFSKIMRLSLESTFTELTTLEDELDFLQEYIELQRLLKNNSFDVEITIADSIEPFDTLIPGMIIQPFIENAIEHGLSQKEQNGLIRLEINLQQNEIHILISDNGSGASSQRAEKAYPSRATQIIRDRLSLLSDTYKKNAKFETDFTNESGYQVTIVLPQIRD